MARTRITTDQLNPQIAQNYVTADETTTSATYVDIATVQSVSVNVGKNGQLLVHISAGIYGAAFVQRMSFALSGANTLAASDQNSLRCDVATFQNTQGRTFLITGLTPGNTTVTAKFKTSGGTAHFFERNLVVEVK